MEFKVVVSDPENGKAYQREVKDEKANKLNGLKIGDTFDGSVVGLSGYTLQLTGGSDQSGFPMKKSVTGSDKKKVLMKKGVGYQPKEDVRRKKTVKGSRVDEDIAQINAKVVESGSKEIEELLGLTQETEETEEQEEEESEEE